MAGITRTWYSAATDVRGWMRLATGGGMKVIRHILFYKILRLEIEKAHRPRVVN